ncbi:MAG: hypothetical protein ABSE56_03345 [Bryobacteraceae bacterium]|jgi:hypothetical protein
MSWAEVTDCSAAPDKTLRDVIAPALDAVPARLASRLGPCRVRLVPHLADPEATSQWTATGTGLEVEVAVVAADPHDLALEALLCLGQALWESTTPEERAAWLKLLDAEMRENVAGEIDEEALEEKRRLLGSRTLARSPRRLLRYAGVSFASTLAEYIHALWHDVTVRSGPDHLPAEWLRRRLELFEGWFPPPPGRRLFAE